MRMPSTDPAVAATFTMPMSLATRLDGEQKRQGIANRSLFLRLALEAYVAKCEANLYAELNPTR